MGKIYETERLLLKTSDISFGKMAVSYYLRNR